MPGRILTDRHSRRALIARRTPSPGQNLRANRLALVALCLLPAVSWAGTTTVFPGTPTSRSYPTVRYSETDWFDSCPPTVDETSIVGTTISVRLAVPPDCVPEPGEQSYFASFEIGRLDPGSYSATVEAPDFHTGATESDTELFEVVPAVNCEARGRPGASLLLPYFEANLDDSEGQRTLFAIGTVANHPTLVHGVLWTNWGLALLSFDTVLPPDGMKTFDVANLLSGTFPSDVPPSEVTGCTTPLTNPTIDLEAIRALFTGQPSHDDGLCYSTPNEIAAVATGYITVDVVRSCSGDQIVDPWDAGYFEEDLEVSRATQENVLWGDFYLVKSGEDLAEGETLVSLFADAERYGVGPGGDPGTSKSSFYRDHDHRMPLPHANRSRFLDGGAFDADTEILAWTTGNTGPAECVDPPASGFGNIFGFQLYDEAGVLIADEAIFTDEAVRRFKIGENTPLIHPFGVIDMDATFFNGVIGVPLIEDLQSWMLPIVRAEGRFGVASGSMPVEDFCRP